MTDIKLPDGADVDNLLDELVALNSHPVMAPHMTPLVMHYGLSFGGSWGWSSGIVGVPSVEHRGFKTACKDFF